MKQKKWLLLFLLAATLLAAFTEPKQLPETWTSLFNGKNLQGWDSYIAPDMDSIGKAITGVPVGLNKDPKHVFTGKRSRRKRDPHFGRKLGRHFHQK